MQGMENLRSFYNMEEDFNVISLKNFKLVFMATRKKNYIFVDLSYIYICI